MSLGVVYVEGDVVFSLNAGAVLVVYPDVLSLEAQLEEFALGDRDLHPSVLTVHLCLKNVVICCRTHNQLNPTVSSKSTSHGPLHCMCRSKTLTCSAGRQLGTATQVTSVLQLTGQVCADLSGTGVVDPFC